MSNDERLWTTEQAADHLAINVETLARWRRRGYGPPAIPLVDGRGGMVRYDPTAVREWLAQRALTDRAV